MTPPLRLTLIGDIERSDHHYITELDKCFFWGEYTPYEHTSGLNWDYSPTNRLITNLKKKMDRQGQSSWRYKLEAIDTVGRAYAKIWLWEKLLVHRPALVPMPPSKARTDAMYDPRMQQVIAAIATHSGVPLDMRDCLSFNGTVGASHETDCRPSPETLYNCLHFDGITGRITQPPGVILLFDDMITTGAHFVAAKRKLGEVFPGIEVVGVFVARRRVPNPFAVE